ncbi:unnamed protein product, partial [Discosporangium mesarthrocarpum]
CQEHRLSPSVQDMAPPLNGFTVDHLIGAHVDLVDHGTGTIRAIEGPEVVVELHPTDKATPRSKIRTTFDALVRPRSPVCAPGTCVLTTWGTGVVVQHRISDDVHVVRMWRPRGSGSALAFLQRAHLLRPLHSAVGLRATTPLGEGTVAAFKRDAGQNGVFVVKLSWAMAYLRDDSVHSPVAKVMPLVERVADRSTAIVNEQARGKLGSRAREMLATLRESVTGERAHMIKAAATMAANTLD